MFTEGSAEFTVGDGEIRAFYHAIAPFTVALLPPDGLSVGTGVLVNWKSSPLILTANHNLTGTKPSAIKFVLNPGGTLREGPMNERRDSGELYRGVLLPVEDDEIADQENDIVAIRLKSDRLAPASKFCELDSRARTIREGATVILAGFAWDNSFPLAGQARAVGVTTQSGTYDDKLNARNDLSSEYNSKDHFLLPYTRVGDGVNPHGISGTAAWCNADQAGAVWAPHPILVGVETAWFPKSKLLKIVRLGPVLDLLGGL
jgi:hypothetical protein